MSITKHFLPLVLFIGLTVPASSFAQTYILIDSASGLYCADFENGEHGIVQYDPSSGVVNPLSSEDRLVTLKKRAVKNKSRLKQLRRLKKRNLPSNKLSLFGSIYKVSFGKKFKGGRPKAVKLLGRTIRKLGKETKSLQSIIDKIKKCLTGDLPDPQAGILRTVSFQFTDPDSNDILWMYGIAAIYKLKDINSLPKYYCLGAENSVGGVTSSYPLLPTIPELRFSEPEVNPCARFSPSVFSSSPRCSGTDVDGDPLTAVVWLDVNFGSSPFPIVPEENYQARIDQLGLVVNRAFNKKTGCQ